MKERKEQEGAWGVRIEITCSREGCGKKRLIVPSQVGIRRYCSRRCFYADRKAQTEKTYTGSYRATCQHCEETFVVRRKRLMKTQMYCSNRCSGAAKLARMGELNATSIERETWEALRELGIPFAPQHPLGFFVVDAFLPELKTVIECQGDFYHCNPATYPDGPKHPIQRRVIGNDRRRFTWMANRGYRVIELWEADIRERGAKALIEEALTEPELVA